MIPWFENIWLGVRYFFLFPLLSVLPSPLPYILTRYLSRLEYHYHSSRTKSVKEGMAQFLDGIHASSGDLEELTRRYFEVVFCDEIDVYLYLSKFSRRFLRSVTVEGEQHLEETLKSPKGILLSAHFGGAFWILPFLRAKGISARFFSADIEKGDYDSRKALYYYQRLRIRAVKEASGERTLYKREGRKELIKALNEGKWVIILFDVPPFRVKDVMEVPFLGRTATFPRGIISIAKETHSPILPFFSFLDGGNRRRLLFERPFFVDDVEAEVKTCVKLIESKLLERPDHWHLWPVAKEFIRFD